MKKSILIVALAVVLVLAFAATASRDVCQDLELQPGLLQLGFLGRRWHHRPAGQRLTLGMGGSTGANSNTNQTAGGGVHSNYQTTTAKCGICHSVHRAKAGGVKLLNTATATCAGCHISGTSTVTNVVIAWGTVAAPLAGPHGSANGACNGRACHAASPHGADGSVYGLFNAKLLNKAVDTAVAAAAADPANSGVTAALLTGAGANTDFTGAADAVRVGYTCNQADCHVQTMLAVVEGRLG